MTKITLYTRPGCGLCEDVEREIQSFAPEFEFELTKINIDEDPDLKERYGHHIPAVAVAGVEVFRHRMDAERLRRELESGA